MKHILATIAVSVACSGCDWWVERELNRPNAVPIEVPEGGVSFEAVLQQMQAEALKVNDKAEFISVKAIGFDAKGHVDIERENGVRAVFEWRYSDPSKRLGEDIVEGSVTLVTSQKCAPVKAPCIVITPGRSVMVLNRQRGRRLPECTLADAWAAAREKLGLPQDTIANAVAGSTPELWHIAVEGHNELAVSIDDKTCVYVPPNEAIRREDAYRKP